MYRKTPQRICHYFKVQEMRNKASYSEFHAENVHQTIIRSADHHLLIILSILISMSFLIHVLSSLFLLIRIHYRVDILSECTLSNRRHNCNGSGCYIIQLPIFYKCTASTKPKSCRARTYTQKIHATAHSHNCMVV